MKLVLDTNVWLDLLVFRDPSTVPLRAALDSGAAQAFIDEACLAELSRALGYPLGRWTLDPSQRAAAFDACLAFAKKIDRSISESEKASLPRCRDPDDQKFLELALAAKADRLLTKDLALLELPRRKHLPFQILKPGAGSPP